MGQNQISDVLNGAHPNYMSAEDIQLKLGVSIGSVRRCLRVMSKREELQIKVILFKTGVKASCWKKLYKINKEENEDE